MEKSKLMMSNFNIIKSDDHCTLFKSIKIQFGMSASMDFHLYIEVENSDVEYYNGYTVIEWRNTNQKHIEKIFEGYIKSDEEMMTLVKFLGVDEYLSNR